MNLRSLKYFCAAHDEGSAVAAARVCHVTQPVISNALSQLEDELGVTLFLRQRRGLAPTPAAQRLYTMARKLLADSRAIVHSFQDDSAAPSLSLQVMPALSIARTGELLRLLRRELPRLQLRITDREGADATLTASNCAPQNCDFLPLWSEHYVLAVPEDDPLAIQPEIRLHDLDGRPFIERSHCENSRAFDALLGESRVVPDVRARVTSEEWALGLCAAGLGVTLAPAHAVPPTDGVVVRDDIPELVAVHRSVGLAYPAPTPLDGALADVLRICREHWSPRVPSR